MPVEENKEGGEKAPAFDAKKFKEEMMDQNKQFMETTMQTIQGNVKSMIEGSMAALKPAESRSAPKGGSMVDDDMKSELEALGLTEEEGSALVNLVAKKLKKDMPAHEEAMLGKVDTKLSFDKQKERNEASIKTKYPDIVDKNSALFKQAQIEWNNLSDAAKSGSDATTIAIRNAAAELGIKPTSLADAQASAARNEHGEGGGGSSAGAGEPSKKDLEFADLFNVSADKFKKNLKLVSEKARVA